MLAYKVYKEDRMGFESDIVYACKNKKAIQLFNNVIRKELKDIGGDIVNKEDFSEEVSGFREYNSDKELICRTYPLIIYKDNKNKRIIANIPYWEDTSYEYNEYEIIANSIVLEEIKLID